MKKLAIALALILSVTMMNAQNSAMQAAIDKAAAATENAKKAQKPETWIALAKAYLAAYDQPTKSLLPNSSRTEISMLLKGQKVLNSTVKTCIDTDYTVDSYSDKDLYYKDNGVLDFWVVTKPAATGDLLSEAAKALSKAAELDTKGAKAKDIKTLMESVHDKFDQDARFIYLSGDFEKSSDLFKKAADCYATKVINKIDTSSLYYTALVSNLAGHTDKAIEYYNKCIDLNYYSEGNTFANLAEIYRVQGNNDKCKETLELGFSRYPNSQGILVGLINQYRETNEDTQKLFDLIHQAQKNEPSNASLYYCEGDIYKELGELDKAASMYAKSTEIDPNYIYGIVGQGILYYDAAVELQKKASEELDDTKYMAIMTEMEATLAKGIEPFEKAYGISKDPEVSIAVAEYLKNIYFRLRDKNESYPALYEKYNAVVAGDGE